MICSDGLLPNVTFHPSPHCDARPEGTVIDLIVMHCISLPEGEFNTPHIHALFMGTLDTQIDVRFSSLQGLHVSAHVFIDRAGVITQYVPFHQRAWHAGISQFQGRPQCNDFSIGIELEGTDHSAFTPQQYAALHPLIRILQHHYPYITPDRIVGHEHIAPGRKTDPGRFFDWESVRANAVHRSD